MIGLVCFLLMDLTALLNRLPRAELTVYNLNQMLPFFTDRLQCRRFLLKKGNFAFPLQDGNAFCFLTSGPALQFPLKIQRKLLQFGIEM
jgi:hypothetical protein